MKNKSEIGGSTKPVDPKQREYYLKNLPDTPEKVAASHDKIIQAYYNLGFYLFRRIERLSQIDRSI